jgi:AcrR family transcriptional regulator
VPATAPERTTTDRTTKDRTEPPRLESLDRHQRARRDRIVAAAVELMLERDYDSVQMKDLAGTAGVALGTMYRYFRSKDHLLAEALVSWSDRFATDVAAPPGNSLERLKAAYRRASRAFERYPRVYSHVLALQASSDPLAVEQFERFSTRRTEAFASFLPRVPSPRREQIVEVMGAVLDANLRDWTLGRQPIRKVYERLDHAAELVLG